MKIKLANLLKEIESLALKADLSAEEAKRLQDAMQEKATLELQISIQDDLEKTKQAETDAIKSAAVAAATAEKDAEIVKLQAQLKEKPAGVPLTATGDINSLSVKMETPYDRLDAFDLALRYELLKSWGKEPSEKHFRALVAKAAKMAREQDVLYTSKGQAVKAPALDWSFLSPKNLLGEDDGEDLAGVKAADLRAAGVDGRRLSSDPVTKAGIQQLQGIAAKANEVMYSTYSGYGSQWVPTLLNALLWRSIRLNAVVLPQLEQFDMPSQPFDYPVESTDPTFYTVSEVTAESQLILTGGPFTDSKLGTAKKTFSAGKLGAISYWSEEMEEDSLIAAEPQIRDQYNLAMAHNIDYALINGDEDTGATNISYYGSASSAADRWMVVDGIRDQPLAVTTTDARDGGTLTIDDFAATLALMGTAGKYGINPSDLIFLSDTGVYHKAKVLGEILTFDKFGPMATVYTGQLASVFGVPLLVSEDYPLTNSSGYVHSSTGNTLGSFLAINKRGVRVGWRRRPRIQVFAIPGSEARAIVGSARFDIQFMVAGLVACSYNITV